jgi:hypothetical protein
VVEVTPFLFPLRFLLAFWVFLLLEVVQFFSLETKIEDFKISELTRLL